MLSNYRYRHTHSKYVIGYILLFHGNDGYVNVPQSYVCMYSVCLVNHV